ncbi:hypothetical protein HYFRA_00007348 [Hymenoscyphus fraxineus]|uniref:Uncharacterized protein n=1 Tax=Hymenoscyphus fraxineus TaxID=746836 RepID=A0A9N9KTU2_9HELO|nr:hypothetical protein HYFRA_00007348 [Hymenoscyphus fraxineus]
MWILGLSRVWSSVKADVLQQIMLFVARSIWVVIGVVKLDDVGSEALKVAVTNLSPIAGYTLQDPK